MIVCKCGTYTVVLLWLYGRQLKTVTVKCCTQSRPISCTDSYKLVMLHIVEPLRFKHQHNRETEGIFVSLFARILTKCLNKKNK